MSNTLSDVEMMLAIHKEARRLALEDAVAACSKQMEAFLSTEYATGQPHSSLAERFAVKCCIEAIRDLAKESSF